MEITLQDVGNVGAIASLVTAGVSLVIHMTIGRSLDRITKLLARHSHDADGKVRAPIVNGD